MSTYLQCAVMTVAVVLFASLAHAEPILPYSATGPVEIVDYQGNLWRGSAHHFVKASKQTDANRILARFVAEGIQISNAVGKYLMPLSEFEIGFAGDAQKRATVLRLARHYDGKVSFVTDSDAVVYVDDKGVLKTKPMAKITSNAKFILRSVDWAGRPSSIERFDCPPERIKEIRRRYAKVANNKKLRTEVVSTDEEFHGGFEEIHRFYKGHLAEVTTTSFHGSMGGSNFKYFWQSDKVYFYYTKFWGHGEVQETRHYSSGNGSRCRCLATEHHGSAQSVLQFQYPCESPTMKVSENFLWE